MGTFCAFVCKPQTALNSPLSLDAKVGGAGTHICGRGLGEQSQVLGAQGSWPALKNPYVAGACLIPTLEFGAPIPGAGSSF